MARNVKRTCICCSKIYEYCPHCGEDRNKEPWHTIFCSDNCRKVFQATTDYLAGEIDADAAKQIYSSTDLSNKAKYNEIVRETIDKLVGVAVKKEEKNLKKKISD